MSKTKIEIAHEEFSVEMLNRLRQKQKQGFSGWDNEKFDSFDIPKRLHDKSLKVLMSRGCCNKQDLVDVANFAMFLHRKVSE